MRSRLFLTSVLLLLAFAGPAAARGTLDSILPDIRAQHPGRLSDAEPWTDSDGRTHYRIKWLTPEGRILFFNADADSGRFSSSGDGDVGRQWRGGNRSRGDDDGASQSDNNGGGHRSHWNGGDGGDGDAGGGGDWRDRHDRGGDNGDWRRGGTHGDGGNRDWGGGRGGGRGDWHGGGGQGGGDGGHHHHGGN
jgi:hypothetical protein